MTPQIIAGLDTFIRDVTKVGSIPKSEVRRRVEEMLAEEREAICAEAEKLVFPEKDKTKPYYETGYKPGYIQAKIDMVELIRKREV